MLLLMLACQLPSSPQLEETGAEVPENPEIESVSSNCSSTEDKRTIEVQTRGWTGGGRVSFTIDGRNIEEHPLQSVEADAHGQWDTLRVELTIVADPQQVSKGSSTALLCEPETEEALSTRLAVFSPDSREEADCRVWGPDQTWEIIGEYPACDRVLEESERAD
ncbi:MAG: hypothetical protein VX519_00935 [Myxococcota bacterium]|nr:hypothetical protein [Myxococcota bacterium]